MSHSHDGHCHSVASLDNINRAFYIGIGMNLIYTIMEFIVGFRINSLALISDAGHNLSDVASLIISLIGMKLAQKASTRAYTYGYKKASILASLINAILLIFIVIKIGIEAIERLNAPPEMTGNVIMITASIGVIINTISAFLFYKGQKSDINIKGAFLHLLVDALVSVGVIVSGVIIYFTGWDMADVVTSLIIAIVILFSTWGLLTESVKLILDGVPQQIHSEKIRQIFQNHPQIVSIHHLHLWALSSSENALTVHLVVQEGISPTQIKAMKKALRHDLLHQNIHHATFEMEYPNENCPHTQCYTP
ncbi:MAG: cation diffusion facilitator family transporter [Flavobacteriaceae bacterium]|nr:cation diffusion facilitator family transporter [Flavobacteriaceae bacterium]